MSRVVNINSAATVNIASFSGITSNASTGSTYPPTNGINSSANTSSYAIFSATSTSSGYAYYLFNSISVPSNATITSVSCVARGRTSASNTGTSSFQLFAGSTAKGSQTTFTTTTVSAFTLTTGSWTAQEINNGVALRIGTRRANNNNAYSTRFYGATLTVNYTLQTTAYTIASTSNTDSATTSPATQEVYGGESATVYIYTNDLNTIKVEDGSTDVTNQLALVHDTGGTYSLSGAPVSYDSVNSSVAGIASTSAATNGCTPATSTTRASFSSNTVAYGETNIYYNFDCSSIPRNAVINSVSCDAKVVISSGMFDTRIIQLCVGTTKKGSPTTVTNNSINNTVNVQTISNTGTWTREELDNIKILAQGIRGSSTSNFNISFFGATLTVNYTVPAEDYYTYTISNVDADHTVIVSEYGFVPPEEDSSKTYYSVTISSINATTSPGKGTTRVESGTSETITIYPDDPLLTLALDNGVDVSSQLVSHAGGSPTSAFTNITTSYGFVYCASTGYYTSNNKAQSSSAAVCRVTLNLPVRCLVTFQYINYAEATYDFGVFSKVDTALSTDAWTSTSNAGDSTTDAGLEQVRLNTSSYNTSAAQTLTYEIEAGQHFIDIKYAKDQASDSYNDNLQFKITEIQELETNNYYTYTLSNINSTHSLVFVFGDVSYYFVNSSKGGDCRIYPEGQYVVLPGDDYRVTVVPNDSSATVTMTDNSVDVTNNLEYKEIETVKNGVTSITVNYIYTLTNIQTGHTIVVSTSSQGGTGVYIKQNGDWVELQHVYKKVSDAWVEQSDYSNLFTNGTIYVNGEDNSQ